MDILSAAAGMCRHKFRCMLHNSSSEIRLFIHASAQAAAVIHMLDRRAGEDNFKRLLQRLLAVSLAAAPSGEDTHALSLPSFMSACLRHSIPRAWLSSQTHSQDTEHCSALVTCPTLHDNAVMFL